MPSTAGVASNSRVWFNFLMPSASKVNFWRFGLLMALLTCVILTLFISVILSVKNSFQFNTAHLCDRIRIAHFC